MTLILRNLNRSWKKPAWAEIVESLSVGRIGDGYGGRKRSGVTGVNGVQGVVAITPVTPHTPSTPLSQSPRELITKYPDLPAKPILKRARWLSVFSLQHSAFRPASENPDAP
jgi:hypothetical protein